jgi:hypothetical protein
MSAVEIFAIAWIPISCGLIVGFVYLGIRLEGRLERCKTHRAADWGAHTNG